MIDKQVVWVRDSAETFILARIHELMGEEEVEVIPLDNRFRKRICALEDVFPAGDYNMDVDDNCNLMFLNEATLLNNVQMRYKKDKIYTYVANILVAVNPYKEIKAMYSSDTMKKYHGRSLGQMPPHVYAIADKVFRDMRGMKQSQSIIVSGESGAGKTESTKYILRYLCDLEEQGAGPIEQKILDANPILEAFGNAKTTRNNNSSRFGKFMEVHFSSKYHVAGGYISHYLLEKSRICSQASEERNYHVFYLLCAGAPESLRHKLKITKPDDYHYLKSGCTQYFTMSSTEKKLSPNQKSAQHQSKGGLKDPILDDVEDFGKLDQALARLEINENERIAIYSLVAAILHLGNIQFEEAEELRGGCRVAVGCESALAQASVLLGIDQSDLRMALVSRLMQSSRGGAKGTAIMVQLKVYEANNARDALAKAIYSRLFDYIVGRINQSIPFQESVYYIGILDIAGFEYFTVNSYEQFCINYCNEKLQLFFNERIFKTEQELYKAEGLLVPEIVYVNNQDCIDMIESRNGGIFHLLDEESKLPKPDFCHFTMEVHRQWQTSTGGGLLGLPRQSRLKAHRTVRDDEGFLVRHFAGAVCYNTNQFIEKNNDALHASLEYLAHESNNKLIQGLFLNNNNNNNTKGKLTFISVGSKFQKQLGELMEKLRRNATNFIRCVKPNSQMIEGSAESGLVLSQLQCSGMISVLQLMEHGYPSRAHFDHLYNMYNQFLPPLLKSLKPKIFCEAVLYSFKLSKKDFSFGLTRVFFRPGKYAEFDTIMKSDPENLKAIVSSVSKWLVRSRWRQSIFGVLSIIKLKNKILYRIENLIIIQKTIRGYLVRKQHAPRYKGINRIKALEGNLIQLQTVAKELKKEKDQAEKQIQALRDGINAACKTIKNNPKITSMAIDKLYTDLNRQVESQMMALQASMIEQKNREEQERLRKIEEEMRAREEAKRREEQRLREEEEHRRLKQEMEARRKAEEAEKKKQEEADRIAAIALQQKLEKAALDDKQNRERLEQERRDHEIAQRLARETNGTVEGSPPQLRSYSSQDGSIGGEIKLNRSEKVKLQQALQEKQKHDLSKWKYSELRDTINTSCDIELLEACRHEFHRRLKVYHAWKAKNQRRTTMAETDRAPKSIMEAAANSPRHQPKTEILGNVDRYFRIPFVRQGHAEDRKGWWYAHFHGQYVARQMEIHPDKAPVLLTAGTDDMQMCELSLDETGLTRKRGAEILEHEFLAEWKKNGGADYISPAQRSK